MLNHQHLSEKNHEESKETKKFEQGESEDSEGLPVREEPDIRRAMTSKKEESKLKE